VMYRAPCRLLHHSVLGAVRLYSNIAGWLVMGVISIYGACMAVKGGGVAVVI
jgi:hypothetical protein